MNLFKKAEKAEKVYKKLKWYEKLCTWNIQNKRFLKTKNSFLENLRAEGVEEKDFKSLEEGFELLKDCDTYFNYGQSVVLHLLLCLLISIDCYLYFNLFNKGNFGIPTVFVLMLNIILIFSISFLILKIKDSLRIKNIHYFFLYEDLNNKLKEKEDLLKDNSGKHNSGHYNDGNFNCGDWNSGNYNCGFFNSGDFNSGHYNSGKHNSGDHNSGHYNCGDWNSGNFNCGDWNSGNRNNGFFNSNEPTVRMFNKDTGLKISEIHIPKFCCFELTRWIDRDDATEEEKREHENEIKTCGGFLKTLDYKEAWRIAWDKADKEEREKILRLPNYDNTVFKEITGIDAEIKEK